MSSRRAGLTAILVIAAAASLWIVLRWTRSFLLGHPQELLDWVRPWDAYAPAAIVVLQAAQVLLAPIPGQGIGAASGYLYGPWWGTAYSLTGTIIGSFIAMTLARRYGRPLVERLVSREALARLDARASQRGLLFFTLIFLLPFLPDDVACFVAGLSAIPIPALMLAVLAGRSPGIFASAWIGANATGLGTEQIVLLVALGIGVAAVFVLFEPQFHAAALDLVDRLSR